MDTGKEHIWLYCKNHRIFLNILVSSSKKEKEKEKLWFSSS